MLFGTIFRLRIRLSLGRGGEKGRKGALTQIYIESRVLRSRRDRNADWLRWQYNANLRQIFKFTFSTSQNSHFLRGTLYFSSFYWQKQVKINLFERFKKILITQTCTKVFLCVFCSQFVGRTDAVKSKTKSIFSVFCNNIAQQSYLDLLNKV